MHLHLHRGVTCTCTVVGHAPWWDMHLHRGGLYTCTVVVEHTRGGGTHPWWNTRFGEKNTLFGENTRFGENTKNGVFDQKWLAFIHAFTKTPKSDIFLKT